MYIVTQYRDYRLENCIIYRIIILFFLAVFSWDGGGRVVYVSHSSEAFKYRYHMRKLRFGLIQYLPNFTQYSKRQSGVKKDISGSLPYKDDIKNTTIT